MEDGGTRLQLPDSVPRGFRACGGTWWGGVPKGLAMDGSLFSGVTGSLTPSAAASGLALPPRGRTLRRPARAVGLRTLALMCRRQAMQMITSPMHKGARTMRAMTRTQATTSKRRFPLSQPKRRERPSLRIRQEKNPWITFSQQRASWLTQNGKLHCSFGMRGMRI